MNSFGSIAFPILIGVILNVAFKFYRAIFFDLFNFKQIKKTSHVTIYSNAGKRDIEIEHK